EVRRADVAHDDLAVLEQAHAVAVQAVPRRMAARGDRSRRGARHRREHGGMLVEPQTAGAEIVQHRRPLGRDPVAPQSVTTNEYRPARHASNSLAPTSRW